MTATAETPVQKATEYDEHGFSDEDKGTLAAAQLAILAVCQNAAARMLARGLPAAEERPRPPRAKPRRRRRPGRKS